MSLNKTETKKARILREAFATGNDDKLVYKKNKGIDGTDRIVLYLLLDDEFNTAIKLDDLGASSSELLENLHAIGYEPAHEENVLVKKVA